MPLNIFYNEATGAWEKLDDLPSCEACGRGVTEDEARVSKNCGEPPTCNKCWFRKFFKTDPLPLDV